MQAFSQATSGCPARYALFLLIHHAVAFVRLTKTFRSRFK
ncbi:hypothetical protein SEHO0A_03280 [Salmonella enterica subsp. houtenae str. ATCC BAA-1581]|nr:hypothetical protein SEHO0A_03280 [Salmonella enterica subsp. houtenae str. ATCC BAA-1581]